MKNIERIKKNQLPINFSKLKCQDCRLIKEEKAYFWKDFRGILRIECPKVGSLRIEEWKSKLENCLFFEA
jgi:hypothetical protein